MQMIRSLPTRAGRIVSRTPQRRAFHVSPRRLAFEVPRDPFADPELQTFFEKVRNHQGALDAMMAIGRLMEAKGFDMTTPPSKFQMMKLALDGDVREAGMKLMTELKSAGIEMDPETMTAMFAKMRQK